MHDEDDARESFVHLMRSFVRVMRSCVSFVGRELDVGLVAGFETDLDEIGAESVGTVERPAHGVVRAIENGGGGNARARDGDANGAVGVGGFAEGEAVVVARASRARVEETERRGSDEFDVFFGDVVGFNLELGFEGVFTAVGVDVVVVVVG